MSFQDLEPSKPLLQRRERGNASQNPTQSVAAGIFQINTAVAGFRRLVDAIGTSKDTPELRLKLHNTRQRIGQVVKETSAKLKALSDADHNVEVNPNKKVEDAKLARDFQAVLKDFQKAQQLAAERETAYVPYVPPSALPTSSGSDDLATVVPNQDSQVLHREQKRQEVLFLENEVVFNEAIIEERERGIKDIQDQISEANEIFKDLAVLVHEQGIMIDDIDSNIEGSYTGTVQAKTQLTKANKSVKSRTSWCWWLLIVFVLVLVVVVLILII